MYAERIPRHPAYGRRISSGLRVIRPGIEQLSGRWPMVIGTEFSNPSHRAGFIAVCKNDLSIEVADAKTNRGA